MSVYVDGLGKLETNYFKQINIIEHSYDNIDISVIGKLHNAKGRKIVYELEKLDERGILLAIIEKYLNSYKINRITDMGKLSDSDLYRLGVNGFNDERVVNLDLSFDNYAYIYNISLDKYLQDRYNFCFRENFKKVNIVFNSTGTSYGMCTDDCLECKYNNVCYKDDDRKCEPYINISLMTDKNGKLKDFEYKFIRDYLYYIFGKYDDLVKINNVYRETPYIDCFVSEYILECGDISVIIPYNNSMIDIFKIVDEYNIELSENKRENDKLLMRQLKLEGF